MRKILILSVGDSPVSIVKVVSRERFYQLNNSVTFGGKPIGSEEFLNQMVEVLGIIIDRRSKGRTKKKVDKWLSLLFSIILLLLFY
ncbi:hypothetical protein ES708_06007 [subsurface metagenome]